MENRAKYEALKYYLAGSLDVKTRYAEIKDHRYHYLEAGSEYAETLILLHGLGLSKGQWRGFMHLLSKDFRVIAPDIPGLNHTTRIPGNTYTFRALSDWLSAFTHELNLNSYHLLGFSAGACVATQQAVSHPHAVKSLSLLGFPDLLYPTEDMYDNVFDACKYEEIKTVTDVKNLWDRQFYDAPKIPKFMSRMYLKNFESLKPFLLQLLTEISDSSPLLMARLHKITCPTIFIKGSHDLFSSERTLEFVKRAIPSMECKTINSAGHFAYLEKKPSMAAEVKSFVRMSSAETRQIKSTA